MRPRHPTKEVEAAVSEAELLGWRFVKGKGHGWGRLLCPKNDREGCQISVWSTPRNAEDHAKDIRRSIGRCAHAHREDDDEKV
jgi:hypothetical protein